MVLVSKNIINFVFNPNRKRHVSFFTRSLTCAMHGMIYYFLFE